MVLRIYLALRTECSPRCFASEYVCRSCFGRPLHGREYCSVIQCMTLVRFIHQMEQVRTIGDMR